MTSGEWPVPGPEAMRAEAGGSRALRLVDAVADGVIGVALAGELGAVFCDVVARTLFDSPFLWSEEVAKLALSTLAFLGGAVAYRRGHHSFVRAFIDALAPAARHSCLVLSDLLVLLVAAVTGLAALPLLAARWSELTPILAIEGTWIALPLGLGMALLALHALDRLLRQDRRTVLLAGAALALALALVISTREAWLPFLAGDGAISLALALFLVTVLAGLPVAFALLLGTAAYLYASDTAPMVALPQNMVDGTGNFVLLALPFFILAGLVMERGGISLRLVRFVHALVGHLRGGLLQVMVASMYLVSGISGSKTADVAAVGSVMRDMLKREGYSLGEGAAVLAASAAMGETVPPSIAMLVLGSITSLSMAALFLGGLAPAAVIALCLMALIHIRARRSGTVPARRAPVAVLARASLGAVLPLLMPVILFAGILLGVATPTEVSSFAVVYGLVLAVIVYRELDWRGLLRTVIDGASLAGMILFVLAAASSFSWVLTVAYLPQRLVELLHRVDDSAPVFLLGSIALLIVIGSLLEGLPALIILAPLLLPIAGQIGVSELHYGIVLLIAMGVGAFMPPVGVGFYVACAVVGTGIEGAARIMLPYLAVLVLGLLIVAFVPWFTLVLPRAFGFGG